LSDPTDTSPPASEPAPTPGGHGRQRRIVIAVSALVGALVVAVIVLAVALARSGNDKGNGSAADANGANGASTAAVTGTTVRGAGGVVVVNGGAQGGGQSGGQGSSGTASGATTTPTTSTDTTTATTTGDTTTTAASTGTNGGTRHFPPFGSLGTIVIGGTHPKLDPQAAPQYGEANLANGFSPDPFGIGTSAGGPVDVSYLGGSCSGFAATAPTLRINYVSGGSLLRIYFVGANGDPAMVLRDPFGNFYCVDDSFGTVNPTIDFNNPAGGGYDIWITSYSSSATISGTLHLTGSSGNHP
jgi:hypothetical protein